MLPLFLQLRQVEIGNPFVKLLTRMKIQGSFYSESLHLPSESELIDFSMEVNAKEEHCPVVRVQDWK